MAIPITRLGSADDENDNSEGEHCSISAGALHIFHTHLNLWGAGSGRVLGKAWRASVGLQATSLPLFN